jgi:hypothetical protein
MRKSDLRIGNNLKINNKKKNILSSNFNNINRYT